jgi:hypothetical protein
MTCRGEVGRIDTLDIARQMKMVQLEQGKKQLSLNGIVQICCTPIVKSVISLSIQLCPPLELDDAAPVGKLA